MKSEKRIKLIEKIKNLQGDPHFVAITPTIPFHTILALSMAYALKGSCPAALLGLLTCNPFAIVFIYYACYKAGNLLFGGTLAAEESVKALVEIVEQDIGVYDKMLSFADFVQTQLKVFTAMLVGGIVIGVPSGIASYFITKQFVIGVRAARKKIKQERKNK